MSDLPVWTGEPVKPAPRKPVTRHGICIVCDVPFDSDVLKAGRCPSCHEAHLSKLPPPPQPALPESPISEQQWAEMFVGNILRYLSELNEGVVTPGFKATMTFDSALAVIHEPHGWASERNPEWDAQVVPF